MNPMEWRMTALQAVGWTCAVTGKRLSINTAAVHHVVRKSDLRQRRLYHLVWDPRNALVIHQDVHEAHENASRRILREFLRPDNFTFAREVGGWAEVHLKIHHPITQDDRR